MIYQSSNKSKTEMVKIEAILQARFGSTRAPGKILEKIGDRTLLAWAIDRLKKVRHIDRIIVATTREPQDDRTVEAAKRLGVKVFCGSTDDVLGRFVGAIEKFPAETIVRATADNPLLHPESIDMLIEQHLKKGVDYTGAEGIVPLGSMAEVVKSSALVKANSETDDPHHREHVTPYIYCNPEKFSLFKSPPHPLIAGQSARVTVDTDADFKFMRTVYEKLAKRNKEFEIGEVLQLLNEEPELKLINASVRQKKYNE